MNTEQAYNNWASKYDTNLNKTRDLEAKALRNTLSSMLFDSCLEIGCGTGKNTLWLIEKAKEVTAVDLSAEMLAKAKEIITDERVQFLQADITTGWTFRNQLYDLVTFSLVLEHIDHLDPIFKETAQSVKAGGYVYVGELHPFKQYTGSKARFDTAAGQQVLDCFTHHVSDFTRAAQKNGLDLVDINEYFDDENKNEIPRILTLLFKKP
ncbi:MAG: class I SAM-dependent methyltransferase [Ferruginibacter sp.]|nr:class I SAM-dependent methyltransferase [Chitinophagaceae bacterium]